MPTKYVPNTFTNLNNETSFINQLNDNFSDLATLLDTLVSRNGTAPNTLTAALDVNNQNLNNIGSAYIQTLYINGTEVVAGTVTPLPATDIAVGTAGSPGLPVSGDANTGIYAPAADQLGISTGGSLAAKWTTTGYDVVGTLTANAATIANGVTVTAGGLTVSAGGINVTGTVTLPAFTLANGTTATTQSASDNSTKVATTAYVDSAISAIPGATTYSHVRAYRTSSNQNIPNNTITTIAFNAEDYDVNSEFDITTNVGRFTAGATGYYHVSANAYFTSSVGSGKYAYMAVYKNGSVVSIGSYVGNVVSETHVSVNCTVSLSATDYLEVKVYQNSGGNMSLANNQTRSFVTIDRLP